jgi:hypothetical protein
MLWHAIEGIVLLRGSAFTIRISVTNVLVSKALAVIQIVDSLRRSVLAVSISATNVLVPSQSVYRQ